MAKDYPGDDEKKIIGVVFDKRRYTFRTDVDMWLYLNDYEADLYSIEESQYNFRVMLCGKMLGAYDQQTMETKEDEREIGVKYIVAKECSAMKFSMEAPKNEQALQDFFQILYAGDFKKNYMEFELTPTVLDAMVSNFNKDVLKKKHLPIDYAHENEKKAAGWITELKTNEDKTALYAKANWTPNGKQALLDREFSYFSAEFILEHRDAETETDYGPVLRGGALTNIPFLKLPPIIPLHQDGRELNAIFLQEDQIMAEDTKLVELTKTVKLQADQIDAMKADSVKLSELTKKYEGTVIQLSELAAKNKELTERIALEDKTKAFEKLLTAGKACEAQRAHFLADDMVKFAEAAQKVNVVTPKVPKDPIDENVQLDEDEEKIFQMHFAPQGVTREKYIEMSRRPVSTVSALTPVSAAKN